MSHQARNVHQVTSFSALYFERSGRRLTAKQQIACRNAFKVPLMLGLREFLTWDFLPSRGVRVVRDDFLERLRDLPPGKRISVQVRNGSRFVVALQERSRLLKDTTFHVTLRQRYGLPDIVSFTRLVAAPANSALQRRAYNTDWVFENFGY